MARDVKFWKEDGSFKLRVCGVVQVGDKILIDNCDNAPFWGYPGGLLNWEKAREKQWFVK